MSNFAVDDANAKELEMKTVMIVDDEKNLRTLYSQELAEDGFEVVTAANGQEARRHLAERNVDIVVLDIKLEGENGLELLRTLMAKYRNLKVILNSAYSAYMSDFKSWSADAYLVKSSDLTELKKTVRQLAHDDLAVAEPEMN